MNKYKIDFSRSEYGSMEIEAESQEEAEETFWNNGGWEFNDNGDTDIDEVEALETETQTKIE